MNLKKKQNMMADIAELESKGIRAFACDICGSVWEADNYASSMDDGTCYDCQLSLKQIAEGDAERKDMIADLKTARKYHKISVDFHFIGNIVIGEDFGSVCVDTKAMQICLGFSSYGITSLKQANFTIAYDPDFSLDENLQELISEYEEKNNE